MLMFICVIFLNLLNVQFVLSINLGFKTLWHHHKNKYGLEFKNVAEELFRYGIFEKNLKYIDEFNKNSTNLKLGMNHFGTLTDEEYQQLLGFKSWGNVINNYGGDLKTHKSDMNDEDIPESIDWREKGVVSRVKDQGACGSCYIFSAVQAVESQYAIKNGMLHALSEQEVLDCHYSKNAQGCNGGFPWDVLNYIQENGIEYEEAYPYKGRRTSCMKNDTHETVFISGYKRIERKQKELTKALASVGPVSVAIDASGPEFRFYKSGVYHKNFCAFIGLNHAVLAVGYGTENGQDYYLVKNSWGTGWGDNGYIKMARNKRNVCGIAREAVIPIL